MTSQDALNQRLQLQIDKLEASLSKIQAGIVPDLEPLEREVSALCGDLLAAGGDSLQTAEKMREMIGLLESLATELKDFSTTAKGS